MTPLEPLDLTEEIERLGEFPLTGGGFADVWRGVWNTGLETREVAIKVLRSHTYTMNGEEKMIKRLRRELRVWQMLKHKNVIQLYGITHGFGSYASMVSPWMEDGNLHNYLEQHGDNLSQYDRYYILDEIADGLAYLHSFSVVHGDVTPANILMTRKGNPVLIDFGLSQIVSDFHGSTYLTSTIGGVARYTPIEHYREPTSSDDHTVSTRSDIYSFGSIMLHMLSGQVPYHDVKTDHQVVLKLIKGEKPSRPQKIWIIDSDWKLICHCWSEPPRLRPNMVDVYQTIHQTLTLIAIRPPRPRLKIMLSTIPKPPSYYNGPCIPLILGDLSLTDSDSTTISPLVHTSLGLSLPLNDVLQELREASIMSPRLDAPKEKEREQRGPSFWSDSVLEELLLLADRPGSTSHKVRDTRTNDIMVRKSISVSKTPVIQLLRELSITRSSKHDNIVSFHGFYVSSSSSEVNILTEYCEGGSLKAIGEQIAYMGLRIGEKVVCRLAEGVLKGLAYLHTNKTIHRDIQPSNVQLTRDGIVKLCDFGSSGELVDSFVGTLIGTRFYMAPERVKGAQYTIRSDVWSTGITLLEIILNHYPYPVDEGPLETLIHIADGPPPQLDDPGVYWSDPIIKDFIKRTLIMDSLTRPTPEDMLIHPWLVDNMHQYVNMARWVREVWGWSKNGGKRRAATYDTSSNQ